MNKDDIIELIKEKTKTINRLKDTLSYIKKHNSDITKGIMTGSKNINAEIDIITNEIKKLLIMLEQYYSNKTDLYLISIGDFGKEKYLSSNGIISFRPCVYIISKIELLNYNIIEEIFNFHDKPIHFNIFCNNDDVVTVMKNNKSSIYINGKLFVNISDIESLYNIWKLMVGAFNE